VAKTIRLRPEAGTRARIASVICTSRSLKARVTREAGDQDSPAEIELLLDTGAQSGRVDWSLFVTFNAPVENAVRLPMGGWVRGKQGPWRAEIFYPESQASGRRLLRWWRSAADTATDTDRVELLPIEEPANYRRLRELERKAGEPGAPSEIVAFIDNEIILRGEGEVRAGLSGLLNLGRDGRPGPASGSAAVSDCRRCREAREAVEDVSRSLGNRADVRLFDAGREPESAGLAFAMLDAYPGAPGLVPSAVTFVGDELLLGADEIISDAAKLARAQLERGGEHLAVRAPSELFVSAERTPAVALVPVALAGLADGVNPCAFAAMVLLISILATARFPEGAPELQRRKLFLGGGAFCVGVFAAYYLAGLGLFLGAKELETFPVVEALVFWAVWALALVGGIMSLADAIVYFRTGDTGRVLLKVPDVLRRRFAPLMRGRFSRYGLVFGGLAAGVLIAIMEGICTGQMYLPTIQYMARTPGLRAGGAAYLLLYNVLFILPLVAILGVALAGVHFQRLNAFLRRRLAGAKLLLAAVFFLLATVMVLSRL
jgi:cytochrome c biogenesis protein CcdA